MRENSEKNLTRIKEDLVGILVDLGKKSIAFNIDINKGLNVSDVGDKFPEVVPPETDQNKTTVFNELSMSEKKFRAQRFSYRRWSFQRIFLL